MAVKFTDAKKWDDVWFSELTMEQKVMFLYLCDMCDMAGFLEVNDRLTTLQTGIEDVRGTIQSLSKSIIYKEGWIWIKKYIKHQKNLPLNINNNAHKGILLSIYDKIELFPEILEVLPEKDVITIKNGLGTTRGYVGANEPLASPTSKGNSNSNSNSNSKEEYKKETLITRLYKYFVGEENLMGQSITSGTRKILAEAIGIMDVEKWKFYCEARLVDTYKAAPAKFFLEDGWRKYHEVAKVNNKEKKIAEVRRKEAEERKSLPTSEAPDEFKEFVKDFGKRKRKTNTEPVATTQRVN